MYIKGLPFLPLLPSKGRCRHGGAWERGPSVLIGFQALSHEAATLSPAFSLTPLPRALAW